MRVIVKTIDGTREWSVDLSGAETIADIIRNLGLNPEEYITVANGRVVTISDRPKDGDTIILYPVVSGG